MAWILKFDCAYNENSLWYFYKKEISTLFVSISAFLFYKQTIFMNNVIPWQNHGDIMQWREKQKPKKTKYIRLVHCAHCVESIFPSLLVDTGHVYCINAHQRAHSTCKHPYITRHMHAHVLCTTFYV